MPFTSMARRFTEWYHGLFHVAQVTMHDRWVKRLRLIAFLAASSIATQIVLRGALESIGLVGLLPSSIIAILIASAIWLVAYPAMWLRMLTVEMEAKKEYALILHEIHKLHRHHKEVTQRTEEPAPPAVRDDTTR